MGKAKLTDNSSKDNYLRLATVKFIYYNYVFSHPVQMHKN